jgi:hypothetical protein
MVRHVLLLQPKPDATAADIESSRAGLAGLVGVVPGLVDFHWGANFAAAERTDGFAYGFSMDFADRAALGAYGPHPAHKPVAAQVRATFQKIIVFDFEL